MHTSSQKWALSLLLALAFVVSSFALVGAQGDISILYSPMALELSGQRGQRVPFIISLVNESRFATAHMQASVTGLAERRNGVYATRDDEDWEFGASSWIEIDNPKFSIEPGKSHTLTGYVTIPRRAPGSGFATIVVEILPEEKPADVEAATLYYQQLTTSVEITVGQQHRRSAFISELAVVPTASVPQLAMQYGRNAVLFQASLENDGDVHVRGRGQLIIRDMMGRRVRSVPLGSGRGTIIPDATVDFGSVIANLAPGQYEMEARIEYGGHRPAVSRTAFEISDETAGISSIIAGRGMRVDASPSLVQLELQRHGYRASTITVSNLDTTDVLFKITAADLAHDIDGTPYTVEDPEAAVEFSAREWLQIRPDEFVLRPGQRRNVIVGVQVPEGQEGGRYALVKVAAEPAEPTDDSLASSVATDIDVAMYLSLGSDHKRTLQLLEWEWKQLEGTGIVGFGMTIGNSGNIHTTPGGRLTLLKFSPASEEMVGDLIVQRDERWDVIDQAIPDVTPTPLLPGEARYMQALFETELENDNQYQVIFELPQTGDGERPPAYRLDLTVGADGVVYEGLPNLTAGNGTHPSGATDSGAVADPAQASADNEN